MMWGAVLAGWGLFNIVEGIVDHHLLGIHHVNELVGPTARAAWDIAFLAWGVAMGVAGVWLLRTGRRTRP